MDVWNTQSGSAFRYFYAGRASDTTTGYDNRNVVIFRSGSSGSTIAVTYSWWYGSTLVDSDIIFYDGGFHFFTGTSGCGGSNAAYIEDIAAHEFGHALGLNHSDVADATMRAGYSTCSQTQRTLAADDIAGAKYLYPTTTLVDTAPTVSILAPGAGASFAQGTSIAFSGAATDTQDGTVTASMAWKSSLDGSLGTGGSLSKVLSVGTHTITASVTDSGGLSSSAKVSVTVVSTTSTPPPPSPSGPALNARGYKVKGDQKADLSWSGFTSTMVDVYRNGVKILSTGNDGAQTDSINKKGGGSYTYKLCATGTSTCSNQAMVTF
jgi:hypothetical protein